MTNFEDLPEGATFFTRGGAHMRKTSNEGFNAEFVADLSLARLNSRERTFTLEEYLEISKDDKYKRYGV